MCLEGAAGRPGVAPLLLRAVGWTADADDVERAATRSVRSFAVLGLDGTRAGIFEVLGMADVGLPGQVAIGSYSGRSPCAPESEDGGALADEACVKATASCGIAVARVDPGGDDDVPELESGTACVAGDSLLVDIDDDGASESFPIGALIDGVRAPAEEVTASPVVGPSCTATFAIYDLTIIPEPEDPKAPDDPRYHVVVDIAGVVDLDDDGRRELIVSFHYEEGRTFAIYSALQHAGRLELVGEAVPWQ
jgi:hypothetical protein